MKSKTMKLVKLWAKKNHTLPKDAVKFYKRLPHNEKRPFLDKIIKEMLEAK